MTRSRLPKEQRRTELLDVALKLAERLGADKITHDCVAERAGVARSLVAHYFGTATQLRRDVMRAAVKQRLVVIVARGLALRDPHAGKADEALREECSAYLAQRVSRG